MPAERASFNRLLVAVVMIAMLVASCGGGDTQTGKSQSATGGSLRIGTAGQIDSLNPFVAFNTDPWIIFEYEYPFLVTYDTTNPSLVPDFATRWEHSGDYKAWTFHTIPNARCGPTGSLSRPKMSPGTSTPSSDSRTARPLLRLPTLAT